MKSLEELTREDDALRKFVSKTGFYQASSTNSEIGLRSERLYEDYVVLYREAAF